MRQVKGLISTNYSMGDFGDLTKERPIASLPFGGRYRLVDFPLSNMANSGIHTVGLVTPYNSRSIMDHVGVGKEWGLNRKSGGMFVLPGAVYGSKNAQGKFLLEDIKINRPFLERSSEDSLVISAASKLFNIDYRKVMEAHRENEADITLVYKKKLGPTESKEKYLELSPSGKVVAISDSYENGDNCFIETFIIDTKVLMSIIDWYEATSYMDFIDVLKEDLAKFKVFGYEFKGYVSSIGGIDSFMQCNLELLKGTVGRELFLAEDPIVTKTQDNPPAKYLTTADVSNSIVSTGCIIKGAVKNSVLFRGVIVEEGAEIKDSVIMQNCIVGKDVKLENVIFDKFAAASEGVEIRGKARRPLVIRKGQNV